MYEWGLECIRTLQSIQNPFLTNAMLFISFLGDPFVYALFLPLFFWCVDEKKGFVLGFVMFFSTSINTTIKNVLCVPRPYYTDPSLALTTESSFSTPSGHAQGSATFWGIFSHYMTAPRIVKIVCALGFPLIIGFSRVYLGVHYPTDVLLGWAIGAVIVIATLFLMPFIVRRIVPLPKSLLLLLCALIACAFNTISSVDTAMPATFFGFAAGFILLTKGSAPYFSAAQGSVWKKTIRFCAGALPAALLYFGLKMLFPHEDTANYQLFRFIRYAVVAFWASFGAPKFFLALKLAEVHHIEEEDNAK